MALSVESAEQRLAQEEAQLAQVRAELASALAQFNQAVASGQVQRGTQEALRLRTQLGIASLEAQVETMQSAVQQAQQDLSLAQAEARQQAQATAQTQQRAQQATGTPTDSAAQVVQDDNAATGNPSQRQVLAPDGRIQNAEQASNSGSNAQLPEISETAAVDENTDPEVRTIDDTQSTFGPEGQGSPLALDDAPPIADSRGGVGAGREDGAVSGTANETQAVIASRFAEPIRPQANVLDRYFSYNYIFELRIIKPEDYQRAIRERRINFANTGLLIRSGGAKVGALNSFEQKRNQFFDLDFYIDNVVIKNNTVGKGTGSAHAYTDISFTVTEPNGISFLDRLYLAISDFIGIDNYASATYLMTLKFYGYNERGEIETVSNNQGTNRGDPNALVVKNIPFQMSDISFSIDNNLVVYQCKGVAQPMIAAETNRGTVPRSIEISGGTVEKVLAATQQAFNSNDNATTQAQGAGQGSTGIAAGATSTTAAEPSSGAPPNASSSQATGASLTTSLMDALNDEQKKYVSTKQRTYPDRYSIEFAEKIIAGAQVNKKGTPDLDKTPMTNNENTRSGIPETQATDRKKRILAIAAGMPIMQAIETVIRNSSFITDQSDIVYDEKTDQPIPTPSNNRAISWFKINMTSVPTQFDPLIRDYAYDIKFVVSLYEITGMDSPYFPTGTFRGVHKSYPYWFTGQNTAVLDYRQTYNYAYSTLVTGAAAKQAETSTFSLDKIRKFSLAPRSTENAAGAEGRTNEPNAAAASYLYDQSALGRVDMKIIGDPAWMAEGEVFPGVSASNFDYKAFLPNGTINFDAGQPLFEVRWVKGQDYNINTGLANPDANRLGANNPNQQSLVYRCNEVTSEFRSGQFTQQLVGDLYIFPIPAQAKQTSATANPAAPNKDLLIANAPTPSTNAPMISPEAQSADTGGSAAAFDYQNEFGSNPFGLQSAAGQEAEATYSEPAEPELLTQAAPEAPTSNGQDVNAGTPTLLNAGDSVGLRDSSDVELTLVSTRRADRLARLAAEQQGAGVSTVQTQPNLVSKET